MSATGRPRQTDTSVVAVLPIFLLVVALGGCGKDGRPAFDAVPGDVPELIAQGGRLDVVLDVQDSTHQLGDVTALTRTYNGSLPGPTLRIHPGDHVHVKLRNSPTSMPAPLTRSCPCGAGCGCGGTCGCANGGGCNCPASSMGHAGHGSTACSCGEPGADGSGAADRDAVTGTGHDGGTLASTAGMHSPLATNLHLHGVHVDPTGTSDNIFVSIDPGQEFDYDYDIPANHVGGIFWYHAHMHGLTTEQVGAGQTGAIIISGPLDQVPEIAVARERVLLLQEIILGSDGRVPPGGVGGTHYLPVNGVMNPDIGIHPGEVQRWRIVAANGDRFFQLQLDGHSFHQIAQDGIPFATPVEANQILLAPGNRVEVLVQAGVQGSYALKALEYDRGFGGPVPETVLATMVVAGAHWERTLPTTLVAPPAPPPSTIAHQRFFAFTPSSQPLLGAFGINGLPFDATRTDANPVLGTTEEWLIIDAVGEQHPFHLHVNPFQVIAINNQPVANPVWQDTAIVPRYGTILIRMQFQDFLGKSVFHCHILPHEDEGMMGVVNVGP